MWRCRNKTLTLEIENDSKAFIENSNTMDDIYINIDD